jgi:predicted MFS family arabinose efflux permease
VIQRTRVALPADAWWIPLGLAFGPAAAQGFARFGYALLVPGVRHDLDWSFAEAGGVASSNAFGYLVGALVVSRIATRVGLRTAFGTGLAGTVTLLLLSAAVTNYPLVLLVRFLAGVFGATAFVSGGGIAARLPARPGASTPLAVYFAGGGIGIALSGLVIPWLTGAGGEGWREGWIGLGLLGAACSAVAWRCSDLPLESAHSQQRSTAKSAGMTAIHVAYALFGAGYIAYMTFVIALLGDRGASVSFRSLFWVLLGIAAACASPVWAKLPKRLQGRYEFALVNAATALGVLIIIPFHASAAEMISAIVFGGSFLAVVGAVTTLAKSLSPPERWTHVIGTLTGAFALGQCSGPLVSGLLSDRPGGVETGLWLSVALLSAAALTALLQPVSE